ncbi:MAG: peptide chain release factor N(5)-glutamine methyltransferase [Firmicutes bacterium]|nr:peptide chain release factor N(5)-glutamine methyltransferase [Bacillota bacterium]
MTLRGLESVLSAAGVPEPKNDLLILAGLASGFSFASLLARYDEDISAAAWYSELEALISRREKREPLQYIVGQADFYGETYRVTPDTLIPRPDTETLVDYALTRLRDGCRAADLCCGSGIIGIAICKKADVLCDSLDISPKALAVAQENAKALGVCERMTFRLGDVFRGEGLSGQYDMILSNPPYIKSGELPSLAPELSYEPEIALDGGGDGLDFYRALLDGYEKNLSMSGEFVFEIGYDESNEVGKIACERGFECRILRDLSKNPRAAVIKRRSD